MMTKSGREEVPGHCWLIDITWATYIIANFVVATCKKVKTKQVKLVLKIDLFSPIYLKYYHFNIESI